MLCLEYKVCSIEYFLDRMTFLEAQILTENILNSIKQEWEQTRLISYVTAQSQSSKKIQISDIIKFPWDKETKKGNTTVSQEDRLRLIEKIKKLESNLHNG